MLFHMFTAYDTIWSFLSMSDFSLLYSITAKGFIFGGRPRWVEESEFDIIIGARFVDNILTSRTFLHFSTTILFRSFREVISPLFSRLFCITLWLHHPRLPTSLAPLISLTHTCARTLHSTKAKDGNVWKFQQGVSQKKDRSRQLMLHISIILFISYVLSR